MKNQNLKSLFSGVSIVSIFMVSFLTSLAAPAWGDVAAKEWTMLVYINGHNNLDSFGAFNINQMEQVGSNQDVNIVVQWASLKGRNTKRLLVQKDNDPARVTSPIVQEMPPVDMGDKASLLEFIKWGVARYPAQRYFVVVWNHGTGWRLRSRDVVIQDISSDDRTGNSIKTEELGRVMDDASAFIGRKIDLYGSDACLMGMIEVAQEMAGSVNTFVGSQELEPGEGWPYDRFLSRLVQNPKAESNEVGAMLVEAYHEYYSDYNNDGTTLSAIDLRELPNLLDTMKRLKTALLNVNNPSAIQSAANRSTRFYLDDYVDIGDLVENMGAEFNKTGEARPELEQTAIGLSRTIVANKTAGIKAHGLSVWWPRTVGQWSTYKNRYTNLRFNQATSWNDLFEALY